MPQTIDFDDFASLGVIEKGNEYFINIWRSMPATTDRIKQISEDRLLAAYKSVVPQLGRSNKALMNDSYVRYKLFLWEVKILNEKKDKKKDEEKDENENKKEDPLLIWIKWTRVLMRVALQLDGFVAGRSADGTYVVEDVDNIKKEQHAERVKDILKKRFLTIGEISMIACLQMLRNWSRSRHLFEMESRPRLPRWRCLSCTGIKLLRFCEIYTYHAVICIP
jgi:hypothetical protein